MKITSDYLERVYAGILGKIIGVYLGRPFEGWSYDQITTRFGNIWQYVNEQVGLPLIVADDDISGTFTFLRALEDNNYKKELTPDNIAKAWLNYVIENRTTFWWGGLGRSTEHTAYLRLKHGIKSPASGSTKLNGKVVAEQIGAQIFIDGWAMVAPGEPELAVKFACNAASVSHDEEAVYGAQMLAAMESLAFFEKDRDKLLDIGLSYIPGDSIIARMIQDIRRWYYLDQDWSTTYNRIRDEYGYDRYIGGCHIIPNHALIIMAFLYGDDDFQKSLMIVNTCGWDTDCNSGNLGCLLGIKNGLKGIRPSSVNLEHAFDLRSPVADRLYITSADGGRVISDALTEAVQTVNIGLNLHDLPPISPKDGVRFHFEMPGSVQGFSAENAKIRNVAGHSNTGQRSLEINAFQIRPEEMARVATPTFIPSEAFDVPGYTLMACPIIYPNQVLSARLEAGEKNIDPIKIGLGISYYNEKDQLIRLSGPRIQLSPGESDSIKWQIPGDVHPIADVAVELMNEGTVYLDWMKWDGTPEVTFSRPDGVNSSMTNSIAWRKAWINAIDHWDLFSKDAFNLSQDEGYGFILQGCRDWKNYHVSSKITPTLVRSCGLMTRVQGLRRYYALLLSENGCVQLCKIMDEKRIILEEKTAFGWQGYKNYNLELEMQGNCLKAWVNGEFMFNHHDKDRPLKEGGIGLLVADGYMYTDKVIVRPID